MSTKDVFKTFVWEAMIKPIPKLIALYEVTIVGLTGLTVGIAVVGAKIEQKKKK